jgi:hypothetical protein
MRTAKRWPPVLLVLIGAALVLLAGILLRTPRVPPAAAVALDDLQGTWDLVGACDDVGNQTRREELPAEVTMRVTRDQFTLLIVPRAGQDTDMAVLLCSLRHGVREQNAVPATLVGLGTSGPLGTAAAACVPAGPFPLVGTFTCDPGRRPKHLDVTFAPGQFCDGIPFRGQAVGIYRRIGDALLATCFSLARSPDVGRPEEFPPSEHPTITFFWMRRYAVSP